MYKNNQQKENNITLQLMIQKLGINGEGIGYYQRKPIFIKGALPYELVEVKITSFKKTYGYGELVKIIKPSKDRVEPFCPYFGQCGGCSLEHLAYIKQCEAKHDQVVETFKKYFEGDTKITVKPTLGAKNTLNYRNRTQLPCRFDGHHVKTGLYAEGSNELIYVDKCALEQVNIQNILKDIRNYLSAKRVSVYNPKNRLGALRYLCIRSVGTSADIAVTAVLFEEDQDTIEALKGLASFDGVKSLSWCLNHDPRSLDIIKEPLHYLTQDHYITGAFGRLEAQLSPDSFFQLNTAQTSLLYYEIEKAAELTGVEHVLDMYCGIGSIGLSLAHKAKSVKGIDIKKENIDNAKEMIKVNHITNAEMYCGDAGDVLGKLTKEGYEPDVVIVDPPRTGLSQCLSEIAQRVGGGYLTLCDR